MKELDLWLKGYCKRRGWYACYGIKIVCPRTTMEALPQTGALPAITHAPHPIPVHPEPRGRSPLHPPVSPARGRAPQEPHWLPRQPRSITPTEHTNPPPTPSPGLAPGRDLSTLRPRTPHHSPQRPPLPAPLPALDRRHSGGRAQRRRRGFVRGRDGSARSSARRWCCRG